MILESYQVIGNVPTICTIPTTQGRKTVEIDVKMLYIVDRYSEMEVLYSD